MYKEDETHDYVGEFVDLPPHNEGIDYYHDGESLKNEPANVNLQDLFYSPMLSAAPNSAEQTPLMTPSDQSFAMPPSYFSPAMSPSLQAVDVPDFELPKKAIGTTPNTARVRKQPSQRRKWGPSRKNSTSSSRQSSSPGEEPSQIPQGSTTPSRASPGAVTPASLMNVSLGQSKGEPEEQTSADASSFENPPILYNERRFSAASHSSQSSATTPAIRPRRTGTTASSPAIAPYMSPSIAPNDSDMASMLASKSNYQNIIDGKHQQLGLQYPERLAADITSKKASHKIAEQERRNRINVAITELGRLVTPEAPLSSKAATVEAAITYIKELQEEVSMLKEKLGR